MIEAFHYAGNCSALIHTHGCVICGPSTYRHSLSAHSLFLAHESVARREGGRKGWGEGGREGGSEREREREREGERERERERGREGERERGRPTGLPAASSECPPPSPQVAVVACACRPYDWGVMLYIQTMQQSLSVTMIAIKVLIIISIL